MTTVLRWTSAAALLCAACAPAVAQTPSALGARAEYSAQAQRVMRAPVRLRVTPARRIARDCSVRYVEEWRLSGSVIVPLMRCRWVRN